MDMLKRFIILLCVVTFGCGEDKETVDPVKKLIEDIAEIDKYISDNGIQAIADQRGIRLAITLVGTGGLPPKADQTIVVNFTGRFLVDGQIFDTGVKEGTLSGFVLGVQVGLSLMPKGSKGVIFVPSGLAYGEQGLKDVIPPNAIVMFEVELQDVKKSTSELLQFAFDIDAIDDYLADQQIVAQKDSSGLRYVITQEGSGPNASWYDKVKITYTGKLLNSGTTFFTGTGEPKDLFNSRLVDYILAFQVGLQKMNVGSKATFYVPSGLGFGTVGVGNGIVPPNSNLIYEMELVDIIE